MRLSPIELVPSEREPAREVRSVPIPGKRESTASARFSPSEGPIALERGVIEEDLAIVRVLFVPR